MRLYSEIETSLNETFSRGAVLKWLMSEKASPLQLCDVLKNSTARDILEALKADAGWERVYYIANQTAETYIRVERSRFQLASPTVGYDKEVKYSSAWVMDPKTMSSNAGLADLHKLLSNSLATALSERFSIGFEPLAYVNSTCMANGDFLRAHVDHENNRLFGVLLYLADRPWNNEDGGQLGYRCDGGTKSFTPPVHNSINVMKLGKEGLHWVTPVTSDFERYAVIVHLTSPKC